MGIDFLTASAGAARRLQAAQVRHARLKSQADARLAFAQGRHRDDSRAAAAVEARAWMDLLAIPGMTVASASQITHASPAVVRGWISIATRPETSNSSNTEGDRTPSNKFSAADAPDAAGGARCR